MCFRRSSLSLVASCIGIVVGFAGVAQATSAGQKNSMIRGIVRPLNQASIATELTARVANIAFKEGAAFRKGDQLLAFDCERQQAELASAEAQHREAKLALDGNLYLDKRGAVGRQDVEISKARVDKAAAEAQALRARLKQCAVIAPFDGRVTELSVHEHEMPAAGKPFISIIDETTFEIELILPSAWLKWIAAGTLFQFTIDETGRHYAARIIRIAAAVEPVSQTIKVISVFENKDDHILSGMSGTAQFERVGG